MAETLRKVAVVTALIAGAAEYRRDADNMRREGDSRTAETLEGYAVEATATANRIMAEGDLVLLAPGEVFRG